MTLGHSSHTCCWVIWNLPGPKDLVTISCRQLHFLVPLAGFITGLLCVNCNRKNKYEFSLNLRFKLYMNEWLELYYSKFIKICEMDAINWILIQFPKFFNIAYCNFQVIVPNQIFCKPLNLVENILRVVKIVTST